MLLAFERHSAIVYQCETFQVRSRLVRGTMIAYLTGENAARHGTQEHEGVQDNSDFTKRRRYPIDG